MTSIVFSNSEDSDLLEIIEDVFPRYHIQSNVFMEVQIFYHIIVILREGINTNETILLEQIYTYLLNVLRTNYVNIIVVSKSLKCRNNFILL